MFSKKSLLALSIVLVGQNVAFAANVADYNYDPTITKEQTGVDLSAVIDCGYNYADGNYADGTCNRTNPSVKKGYADGANIKSGAEDARAANKNNDIFDPSDTKKLGINKIEDNRSIVSYADTRDLSKQENTITDVFGGTGNVDGLKATYNTNVVPDGQGQALKIQCMKYTDAELDTMSDSTNKATSDLANQCLVIRTVVNTNDQAVLSGFSKTDPLRTSAVERSKANNQANQFVTSVDTTSTTSVNKANSQAYSCDMTASGATDYTKTCTIRTYSRVQDCNQKIDVICRDAATNAVVNNARTYCGFDAGIDVTQFTGAVTFDLEKKTITASNAQFFVKNKALAIAEISPFIGNVISSGSRGNRVYLNGHEIFKGKGTSYGAWDWNSLIVEGWNSTSGGGIVITVPYPTIVPNCKVICKDTWTNMCPINKAYN